MPITRRMAKANGRVPPGRARARDHGARSLSTTALVAQCGAGEASAGFRLENLFAASTGESVFAWSQGQARRCEIAAFNRLHSGATRPRPREQEKWDHRSHGGRYTPPPIRTEVIPARR